jgi:hypothetical protein
MLSVSERRRMGAKEYGWSAGEWNGVGEWKKVGEWNGTEWMEWNGMEWNGVEEYLVSGFFLLITFEQGDIRESVGDCIV